MREFVYVGRPQRVIFGPASLRHLHREMDTLGVKKALVLCTPEQRAVATRVTNMLGSRAAGVFDRAIMHVPIATARDAREFARSLGADCAIAVGGGSTIGLGKAIALDSGLPILAIPTTYAGSEMTPIYGITDHGVKKTGRDDRVLPRCVIYDPELSMSLPAVMSLTSGINAIAHAAEGLYSATTNPILDLMAQEGIAALGRALPLIVAGQDLEAARADALYGAWLCGSVLAGVDMALHHKLCHTLGGSFNLPHAETHTIVLPHALAYNAAAAPQAMQKIAAALGKENAPRGLFDLARDNGAPVALRDLGMQQGDLEKACDLALENRYPNPRPLEREALMQLLVNAYRGLPPETHKKPPPGTPKAFPPEGGAASGPAGPDA